MRWIRNASAVAAALAGPAALAAMASCASAPSGGAAPVPTIVVAGPSSAQPRPDLQPAAPSEETAAPRPEPLDAGAPAPDEPGEGVVIHGFSFTGVFTSGDGGIHFSFQTSDGGASFTGLLGDGGVFGFGGAEPRRDATPAPDAGRP